MAEKARVSQNGWADEVCQKLDSILDGADMLQPAVLGVL